MSAISHFVSKYRDDLSQNFLIEHILCIPWEVNVIETTYYLRLEAPLKDIFLAVE